MIILFMIVLIGTVLYGYFIMLRLDKFIEKSMVRKESEGPGEKEILLYGEAEIIDSISQVLNAAEITYDFTTEPVINEGSTYHWLVAFSKDDADNLLICLLAKRRNSSIQTMAKCNNRIYENVFKQTGITMILQKDIPISRILTYLRG